MSTHRALPLSRRSQIVPVDASAAKSCAGSGLTWTPGLADAHRLLPRLHDTGTDPVSTRSAMRLASSFKTAEQAGDAIHTLLTYGWLQKTPSDSAPHTGRPPAPEYTVVRPDRT